jgi:enoyl-[acyl-carrier-protein] reductase (NADH)
MEWLYFVLGLIAWQIIKMLALSINQMVIEHRQKRFLKLVEIAFKDQKKDIRIVSVDTSDKRSMKRIEEQLRDQYDIPERGIK